MEQKKQREELEEFLKKTINLSQKKILKIRAGGGGLFKKVLSRGYLYLKGGTSLIKHLPPSLHCNEVFAVL